MIGSKIGDYEIIDSLGKGGFGSVWKARSGSGQVVAMKLLNPQSLDNQRVVKKFFHEAMILAKLDHPNITRLLDFFPDGDNYAIVMEYVEGVELKKLLKNGPIPFDTAYRIALQALDAFQYAHGNGILHRDIKPGNIIIDPGGDVKIMDFGIAKMSSTASHDTAASMLSIHYVPPERFDKNREIDARSDIYSLGLVFYEMFTGRRPFDATETSQIMFCHLNEIPDAPKKLAPALPQNLSDAISKALEKDPADRFSDFDEFKAAIELSDEVVRKTRQAMAASAISAVSTDAVSADDTTDVVSMSGLCESTAGTETDWRRWTKTGVIAIVVMAAGILAIVLSNARLRNPPPGTAVPPVHEGMIAQRIGTETRQPEKKPTEGKQRVPGIRNAKGFYEIIDPVDGSPMIHIPAGPFVMGSDSYSSEKPIQTITLSDYYIDKYLVTNARFQKFVEATGYVTDAEKKGYGFVRIGLRWQKVQGANWRIPDGLTPITGRGDLPVSQVSYRDAQAYCRWAKKELPTEAQWEKAARGPKGNKFPWGDADPSADTANFDSIVGSPTPVSRYVKGQSYFGVQDDAGNLCQWVRDWYARGKRATKDPTGPKMGKDRVVKGGSFVDGIESLRAASRDRYPPGYSSFLIGFRCACAYPLPQKTPPPAPGPKTSEPKKPGPAQPAPAKNGKDAAPPAG